MPKKKLILMASKKMDANKKGDRNEHGLIRMSAAARECIGFNDDKVELWPVGSSGEDRINRSLFLGVFHAFKEDIDKVKKMVKSGEISGQQLDKIGFVSNRTFNRLCKGKKNGTGDIWVSNDIHDTVMGSDPEFLIFEREQNRVVSAASVLPHVGEIGCDGAMAEIRPKPEISVEALVKNMHDIFNKNKKLMEKYKFISTCYHQDENRGYPVGGHIHVGNPRQLVNESSEVRHRFYKVLNKILDELLTVPFIKIDGKDGRGRRSKDVMYSGYGHYGDYRTGHGRLEHRTLSGMWLMHPSLSKAVLGTAKAVIDEAFRLISEKKFDSSYILPNNLNGRNLWTSGFNSWGDVPLAKDMRCVTSSEKMIKLLGNSDIKSINMVYLKNWYAKLRELSTYHENQRYIDGFHEILKIKQKEISEWDKNIETNWLGGKKFLVDI